jgi:hypothetical protein
MPKCCKDNCHTPSGSPIIVIPIGELIAGYSVGNTRYSQGTDDLQALLDALEALGEDLSFLDGAQYTLIGAIDTSGPNSIHMLTEDEGEIDQPVQDAFFDAEHELETAIEGESAPTTTVELADFIQLNQTDPATGAGVQEIYNEIFVEPTVDGASTLTTTLDSGGVVASVEAEGDLFPHDPGDPVVEFDMSVDKFGVLTAKTLMEMTIDIKPGNADNPINIESQGVIPVAILSLTVTDSTGTHVTFDAPSLVDPTTAKILGVLAEEGMADVDDVNGDGVDDLILHFDTQLLVAAGLDVDTTELEMLAQGYANDKGFASENFFGTDNVSPFANEE